MVLFFSVRRITVSSSGSSGARERLRAVVTCLRDSQWKRADLVHARVYWVRVGAARRQQPIQTRGNVWRISQWCWSLVSGTS